jgi:hypothetical protein
MNAPLAIAIVIGGLLLAGWCLVPVVRDRWIDRSHLAGLALLELAMLVQAGIATARLIGGGRPAEYATFIGYLLSSVLIVPAAVALSWMERTRYGSVIAMAGALVAAVVTLRLRQVWGG